MTTKTPEKVTVRNVRGETCVIWQGYVNPGGYGRRGHVLVHREALARKLGRAVRAGMDACHTCDVRLCVNPDHLYEGTRRQNMADAKERRRTARVRGEARWGAKLSTRDVLSIRRLSAQGESHASIARAFRVHPATISRVARGIWRTEVTA